jgi:caffeoyl-CoA O-methyltransferase
MADPKSFHLTPDINDYLLAHSKPIDDVQRGLIAETTQATGAMSRMQISPEQGQFMHQLARAIGARDAVEVGTFTGYSALAVASALPPGGRLICCDVSDEWTAIGVKYWKQAGVDDRVDLRIGPALETLMALDAGPQFDLAFIDADKTNYVGYYEAILPRMRERGVILVDNVLWGGRIIDESDTSDDTIALRAFNDHVAGDDRVDCVMLPIADGLTFITRRP